LYVTVTAKKEENYFPEKELTNDHYVTEEVTTIVHAEQEKTDSAPIATEKCTTEICIIKELENKTSTPSTAVKETTIV